MYSVSVIAVASITPTRAFSHKAKTITLQLNQVVLEGEQHRVGLTAKRGTLAEKILREAVRKYVVEGVTQT